jgi:putative ABC transport system permease protein
MLVLQIALRMLAREWRSGELGVLLLAVTVAVTALTGVGFLVERIGVAIDLQASEVLAADLRLGSPQPLSEKYIDEAQRRGIRAARSTSLLSVVFFGEQSQLSNVRAVSDEYPLRGAVRIATVPFSKGDIAMRMPSRGEVWPDSRLLAAVGARVGSTLSIGIATFRVGRVLISRPDQGGTFSDLAPSLIMNELDLPSTGLIQPGSRVSYAQLFAADRGKVDDFKSWLQANKASAERVRDISDASPQVRNSAERATRFLTLASLVSVLLCAIAVAMCARRYVQRHLDTVALLKTLGATRGFTLSMSVLQLLSIACLGALLGSAAGFLLQQWLLVIVRDLLNAELPPASATPLGIGFLTAIAVLAGFALPSLLQLSRVPALRVLRRDIGPPRLIVLLAFGPAALVVAGLVYWVARDGWLFAGFLGGLVVFLIVLGAAGALLVHLAGRLRGTVGVAWRYGLANLNRRRTETLLQIAAFGLGVMVLLLLAIVRNDLSADWRRSLPVHVPNYFFVNIPPQDRSAFVAFLQQNGAGAARVLPMVRGRLTHINGRPVEQMRFGDEEGEGFAGREQNLTWSEALGSDNRLVAGRWWTAADRGQPLVSLATEFQKSLGLELGDRLTFDVAGEHFEVKVASIRQVKWDSFQPNFFIVFAPGVLEETAGTYMTSANLEHDQARTLAALAHRFPSVSIFDIDELLAQVRSVMDKALLAVQSVFLFTLFAGLTVMLAAIQSSGDQRRFESAMLRTLGANRGTVLKGVLTEFAMIGLLSGMLASAGATIAAYFVSTRLLWMKYSFDPWMCVAGIVGGTVLVTLSGWLATRSVIEQPPLKTLRAGVT